MEHKDLTIVSVYGHNDGSGALPSIVRSMRELPGSRGLLLSIERPKEMPDGVEWRKIYPLDYRAYSTFMLHCLYAFIDTEFCLVVQDDGWVLDGRNFKPEYYDYDYIGGITHAGLVGDSLLLGFGWVAHHDAVLVQNGGFSLRSRRLLEACNKHGIAQAFSGEIHLWNEDVQLSCLRKPWFEELGYRIAPPEVAKAFSLEHLAPVFHDDLDFTKLLGHHSTSRRLIKDNEILVRGQAKLWYREVEFLEFLQSKGYVLNYAHESAYQG